MYTEQDLVRIAKREQNKKRNYLVVNRLQAKHIPVSPGKAFAMFDALAELVEKEYRGETLLFIGFAETATAIGARLAVRFGCDYIQTTREDLPGEDYLYFTESHSHAVDQKLVKSDMEALLKKVSRIIFVEDEVTTGNTILKIVDILAAYAENIDFSAASLLNGMDEEAQKRYQERGIRTHFLVKTDHSAYAERAEQFSGNGISLKPDTSPAAGWREICAKGWMNARRQVNGKSYQRACENLWDQVKETIAAGQRKRFLVLGTEEFMYPAYFLGVQLEKMGMEVKCHASTRSPIAVSREEEYPLHKRYELASFYEEGRKIYLYDIGTYEEVLVVTDAQTITENGKNSLFHALISVGNRKITMIRWCL